MIEFIGGDLLESKELYIAQGVAEGNQEGLGTGLALKISEKWPKIQAEFKKYVRTGVFKGGDIWVSSAPSSGPQIIYLATQPDMYHARVSYLRKSLKNLAKWSHKKDIESVGLPKIGAGLGKLSWESEVKPLFIEYLTDCSCRFVIYENFKITNNG